MKKFVLILPVLFLQISVNALAANIHEAEPQKGKPLSADSEADNFSEDSGEPDKVSLLDEELKRAEMQMNEKMKLWKQEQMKLTDEIISSQGQESSLALESEAVLVDAGNPATVLIQSQGKETVNEPVDSQANTASPEVFTAQALNSVSSVAEVTTQKVTAPNVPQVQINEKKVTYSKPVNPSGYVQSSDALQNIKKPALPFVTPVVAASAPQTSVFSQSPKNETSEAVKSPDRVSAFDEQALDDAAESQKTVMASGMRAAAEDVLETSHSIAPEAISKNKPQSDEDVFQKWFQEDQKKSKKS